jgi:hypothetical protein
MPGTPAAGGWGGSNRTLGIVMEGFTDQEVVVPALLFLPIIMSARAVAARTFSCFGRGRAC